MKAWMSCVASSRTAPPKAELLFKLIQTDMMIILIMSVSACGKKPSMVDPPDDDVAKFPAIYPDPALNK